jgi:hypothetical protein
MDKTTHISASFFTRVNIQSEKYAREFFGLLIERGGILVPQEFDGGQLTNHRWVTFDKMAPELAIQVWKQSGSVTMRRKEPLESFVTTNMRFAANGRFNTMNISVEDRYFDPPDQTIQFLDLCLAFYDLLHPAYGLVHSTKDKLKSRTVLDSQYGETILPTNLSKGLPGIYWANFLGPEYVRMFGKQRLISSPNFHLQELHDDGILIVTSQTPLNPSSRDSRLARSELREFLGEDAFYPSQAISTRVPEFRFDVPPIRIAQDMSVVHDINMKNKKAKSQNFINNVEEYATLLVTELAEQGIELDASKSSLHMLDRALGQKRDRRETMDPFSIRLFAAYAGETIRQALDGEWLVDETTGEAAVQIKGARIYPLARVFKFLESEEKDAFVTLLRILEHS